MRHIFSICRKVKNGMSEENCLCEEIKYSDILEKDETYQLSRYSPPPPPPPPPFLNPLLDNKILHWPKSNQISDAILKCI